MNQAARFAHEIRLVGGRPALDFVNTIHDRFRRPIEDHIRDPERYLGWAQRAGLMGRSEVRRVNTTGGVTESNLTEVRRLREQAYEVFVAHIQRRPPDRAALAGLDAWIQRAWRAQTLTMKERAVQMEWRDDAIDAMLPLRRIALDALDILQTVPQERLKACAAEAKCGWLFVDDSKNNSRRWCSMDMCGTDAKMRRYRGSA